MKEQIISLETAELAKEKGFKHSLLFSDSFYPYIIATQSLLQKWLREKHNYCVLVKIYDDAKYYYEIVWIEDNEAHSQSDENGYFSTYEEALEEGLQNTLKLIS